MLAPQWMPVVLAAGRGRHQLVEWHKGQQTGWQQSEVSLLISTERWGYTKSSQQSK